MGCQEDLLVDNICEIYEKISRLESLKPCKEVNFLFSKLVLTCIPPNPIDVTKLSNKKQETRSKLIRLCGEAEGLLESHYSTILGSYDYPLDHLKIFPYFSNYINLSRLEFTILNQHCSKLPSHVAFVGSGPLPLTSIVLATHHLKNTTFHNYDIDPLANSMASKLVSSHPDLSHRMHFKTIDIMKVTDDLKNYEVVFLAALVGMDKEEKTRIVEHLAKHMATGATLMVRSAHGARAFIYPVVEPNDLRGFKVLNVFHPTGEVINSVVIAKKIVNPVGSLIIPNKCSDINMIQGFNHLKKLNMTEEVAVEDKKLI